MHAGTLYIGTTMLHQFFQDDSNVSSLNAEQGDKIEVGEYCPTDECSKTGFDFQKMKEVNFTTYFF